MYELNKENIDNIIKEGKDFDNYLTDYCKIIDNGIDRGLDKSLIKYYTEKHHILPRCVKGEDEDYNYVLLTALEHIVSHILLYRMYPDEIGFYLAVGMMIGIGKNKNISSIVSKNRKQALKQINSNVISELRSDFANKSKKIVVCFDIKSYEVIKIYNGVTTAKKDGIPYKNIGTVLSGKRHSTGGYGWMTLKDYQKKYKNLLESYYDKLLNGYIPVVKYSSKNVLRAKKHFISPAYKKLVCLDINHNIVKIYNSLVDTEKDGFSVPLLSKTLNKKSTKEKFHRGYYWEFYDKFIQTNEKELKEFSLLNQELQIINAIRKEDRVICCDSDLNILKIYESLKKRSKMVSVILQYVIT